MSDALAEQRTKKALQILTKNTSVSVFSILFALALVGALLSYFSLIGTGAFVWIMLALALLVSALLAYYNKTRWSFYPLLAWTTWVAVFIRTRNLAGLRDITTGGWTLGPDLDPFLFLRWAKYIITHGSLYAVDPFRYVPLGFDTKAELVLLPYMISWFHKLASLFGSVSIEQSAALFPVFMFALTVVAFYWMNTVIFSDSLGKMRASIVAVVASLFLGIIPALLPRTIAGIPEKESAAFLFLFLGVGLFIKMWKEKRKGLMFGYAIATAVVTALMALVWGGYTLLVVTVGIAVLIAFLLGEVNLERYIGYTLWLWLYMIIMLVVSDRFSFFGLLTSTTTGVPVFTFVVLSVHFILFKTRLFSKWHPRLGKLPAPVISLIAAIVVIFIGAFIFVGPSFVIGKLAAIKNLFVKPTSDRIGVTVAENKQPYFAEWVDSFGPTLLGVHLAFTLFMIGSIVLFFLLIKKFEVKQKIWLMTGYIVFLLTFVFSRYTESGILNGENFVSVALLFGGFLFFVFAFGKVYYTEFKKSREELFKSVDFSLLLLLVSFVVALVAVKGAVRLIMVMVPPASTLIAFLIVSTYGSRTSREDSTPRVFFLSAFILFVLLAVVSAYAFYQGSVSSAQAYVPSVYTQQWQKAMAWVRTETPQNAVFSHWWDYGYWVQSMGERATMVDGGNAIGYWNYLVGRFMLTNTNETEALEMLYAHNVSYFLIDSSDIGKYAAFASIGSNETYDRRSFINAFTLDPTKTLEGKNKTAYFYTGGTSLDEDIVYDMNGTSIYLPGLGNRDVLSASNLAGMAAVHIEIDSQGRASQPVALYVYQGKQYSLPLRYLYSEKSGIDFGSGVEAGVFLMPSIIQAQQGSINIQENGALLYLSRRVVNNLFARLYLYGQNDTYFKEAHVQDDFIVESLKSQGVKDVDHFIYYQGVRGPIKIWEVTYPPGIQFKKEFIATTYPKQDLIAR